MDLPIGHRGLERAQHDRRHQLRSPVAGRVDAHPRRVLDHVGRRSGTARTNPLIYLDDAPNLVVVASKGAPTRTRPGSTS